MSKDRQAVLAIIQELKALYPDGICSLEYQKDYELLFSVRLAAQCTDERVNQVTPALFARYPTLEALAQADISEVEQYIHSTGFFRAKARDIVLASQMLLRDYGGKVPNTMEDLLKLPGVGRKTANLILGDVYHVPGVVVADTHCIRITGLLGLTDGSKDPAKVEQQLRAVLPPEESNDFCHRMVLHGYSCIKETAFGPALPPVRGRFFMSGPVPPPPAPRFSPARLTPRFEFFKVISFIFFFLLSLQANKFFSGKSYFFVLTNASFISIITPTSIFEILKNKSFIFEHACLRIRGSLSCQRITSCPPETSLEWGPPRRPAS